MIAPPRSKGIQDITGPAVVVKIALKIVHADMNEQVNLQFRQLPDDVERQPFEVIRVQEGKMQSARVHRRDDLINGHIGWVTVANSSAAERADARIHGRRISGIKIVE